MSRNNFAQAMVADMLGADIFKMAQRSSEKLHWKSTRTQAYAVRLSLSLFVCLSIALHWLCRYRATVLPELLLRRWVCVWPRSRLCAIFWVKFVCRIALACEYVFGATSSRRTNGRPLTLQFQYCVTLPSLKLYNFNAVKLCRFSLHCASE